MFSISEYWHAPLVSVETVGSLMWYGVWLIIVVVLLLRHRYVRHAQVRPPIGTTACSAHSNEYIRHITVVSSSFNQSTTPCNMYLS
jgi:hypothetical protein